MMKINANKINSIKEVRASMEKSFGFTAGLKESKDFVEALIAQYERQEGERKRIIKDVRKDLEFALFLRNHLDHSQIDVRCDLISALQKVSPTMLYTLCCPGNLSLDLFIERTEAKLRSYDN